MFWGFQRRLDPFLPVSLKRSTQSPKYSVQTVTTWKMSLHRRSLPNFRFHEKTSVRSYNSFCFPSIRTQPVRFFATSKETEKKEKKGEKKGDKKGEKKGDKKVEKKEKELLDAKKQEKKDKIRQMLAAAKRKKPVRRSLWASQMKEEAKKNPPPPTSILLYRSFAELDKLDEQYGIKRPREPLPYPDPLLQQRRVVRVTKNKARYQEKHQNDPETEREQKEPPPRITVSELKQLIDSNQAPTLIDIREDIVRQNEPPIPGSISFPGKPKKKKEKTN